jgi:hypothetical protein
VLECSQGSSVTLEGPAASGSWLGGGMASAAGWRGGLDSGASPLFCG